MGLFGLDLEKREELLDIKCEPHSSSKTALLEKVRNSSFLKLDRAFLEKHIEADSGGAGGRASSNSSAGSAGSRRDSEASSSTLSRTSSITSSVTMKPKDVINPKCPCTTSRN